jgi:transposase
MLRIAVFASGAARCPECGCERLRVKDRRIRRPRHDSLGKRWCELEVTTRKFQCRDCGRYFWERLPGIQPHKRATESFRWSVALQHWDGISRSRLGQRQGIGSATVERWFLDYLRKLAAERKVAAWPRALGIDEHFFTRRHGYATTFCDLRGHKVFDVVLGRSEASLEHYLSHLPGKERVQVVCMDLSTSYRALVRKHFPEARIVADRFHVIRLINQHFLTCWREMDPVGARHRGLRSLMRRHRHKLQPEQAEKLSRYLEQRPALEQIYRFKQRLCYLLLKKHKTRRECEKLAPRFLRAIYDLQHCQLPALVQLGDTLAAWSGEIATMWRLTRNNGITEGFHTKMEVLQRQAYGFRNFQNYRLRVKVMCG